MRKVLTVAFLCGLTVTAISTAGDPPNEGAILGVFGDKKAVALERTRDMLLDMIDFLEHRAQWEMEVLDETLRNAPKPLTVAVGLLLVIRDVLTVAGLFTLRALLRLLGRLGG